VAIFKLSRPQQQQNSGLSAFLVKPGQQKQIPNNKNPKQKDTPPKGSFLLPNALPLILDNK
jgi:hypothetical protein